MAKGPVIAAPAPSVVRVRAGEQAAVFHSAFVECLKVVAWIGFAAHGARDAPFVLEGIVFPPALCVPAVPVWSAAVDGTAADEVDGPAARYLRTRHQSADEILITVQPWICVGKDTPGNFFRIGVFRRALPGKLDLFRCVEIHLGSLSFAAPDADAPFRSGNQAAARN